MVNIHLKTVLILALAALISAACASPTLPAPAPSAPDDGFTQAPPDLPPESDPENPAAPTPTIESEDSSDPNPERIFPTLPQGIERIEVTPETPVTGEAPANLLASILADLTGRLGIAEGQIEVTRAQAVVWPDGSLGCAQPGETYTQDLVNGYWVILQVEDNTYDYRATNQGYFTLCEAPLPLSPPGTPDP